MTTILKDVRWGAGWGLFLGVFYAVIGGTIYLLRDNPELGGLNLFTLIMLYLLGGASGGAVVGLFRPILRQRRTAVLVGMLALLPIAAGTIILYRGPISTWGATEVITVVVGSALLGGFGGHRFWKDLHDFDPMAYVRAYEDPERPARKRRRPGEADGKEVRMVKNRGKGSGK